MKKCKKVENNNSPQRTSFEVKWHHRYDLRSWLEKNFPFLREKSYLNYSNDDYAILEDRAEEIVQACNTVESIDRRVGSAYVEYYNQDWMNIKKACANKDYKALGDALEELLIAIDWQ